MIASEVRTVKKGEILLIGDSMRMGYAPAVRAALPDRRVVWPEENCRSTQHVLCQLAVGGWRRLTDPENTALVLFNCGHWDLSRWEGDALPLTSPDEYVRNIGLICARLTRLYPRARLVFATTTRLSPVPREERNPRTDAEIVSANARASETARAYGAEVLDLYAFSAALTENDYIDNCHLTPEAFARMGRHVAAFLQKLLEEPS